MAPMEVLTGCEEKWLTQKPLFLGKGFSSNGTLRYKRRKGFLLV